MTSTRAIIVAGLLWAAAALPAAAQQRPPAESGFGGFLTVMPGVVDSKSQFNTDGENRETNNLDNSGKSVTNFVPIVLGEVHYSFADIRLQPYAGVPIDNIREGTFFPEIGVRHWLADGTRLSAALLWQPLLPPKTWQDPFVVGERRHRTDADSYGAKLGADRLLGSPVGLRYDFARNDLDKDDSGQFLFAQPGSTLTEGDLDNLKRDASYHRFTINYTLPLGEQWSLIPAFRYTLGDAKGGSNSFDAYRPEIGLVYNAQPFLVSLNLLYERFDYRKENPIFGEKRDEDVWSAVLNAVYRQPFGLEGVSLNALGLVTDGDSDITFYDNRAAVLGVGASYSF
jgi:hypothetical protein